MPVSPAAWSREQWGAVVTLALTHLCNGMCVAVQAPFYPAEAAKKGCSATEYSLVFSIFELTVFLVSPVVGKFLPRMGVTKAFCGGILLTGIMCVAFGFVNVIENPDTFIIVSIIIRVIAAFGNTAFLASSFTLVAQLFPSTVGTVFALVEMAFGVGMILGPTLGGVLYQVGGFTLPFAGLGGVLIVQSIVSIKTIPHIKSETENSGEESLGFCRALAIPCVLLAVFSVFAASIAVGHLQATLERHLAQFHLTPIQVGLYFMLYGGAYALLNPFWGWLSDRVNPKFVIAIGAFLLAAGFALVGPLPILPLSASPALVILAIILSGTGLGAQLVAAFAEAQGAAMAHGAPDSIATYSLVSSLWTSSFALGAFVGPTAAGALYDSVGFDWSTLFTVGWNAAVLIAALVILAWEGVGRRREYTALPGGKEGEDRESRPTTPSHDAERPYWQGERGRLLSGQERYQSTGPCA